MSIRRTWFILLASAAFLAPGAIERVCAQPAEAGDEVLTRGPVHEAFAEPVVLNPQPGIVVTKPPPEAVEEVPPDQRPDGDNVTWVPGYWAWDDERADYLWVSGIWRDLPPGREWFSGYWTETPGGFRWVPGYWASEPVQGQEQAQESEYISEAPPPTLEVGPSVEPPTPNDVWVPGCWTRTESRYAWRPGYYMAARPNWLWIPAHYTWCPRGYVYCAGYWDYPVERRGVLFAPVYFHSRHSFVGFHFEPSIVIDCGLFTDSLFIRPSYCHYYFGDYYAPAYVTGGYVAWNSSYRSRVCYDPFFVHARWEHRSDRNWERHIVDVYRDRREHIDRRPPHTWHEMERFERDHRGDRNHVVFAASFKTFAARSNGPIHFRAVDKAEHAKFVNISKQVHEHQASRKTFEAPGARNANRPAARPKSPLQSKPVQNAPKAPIAPPHQPPQGAGGKGANGSGNKPGSGQGNRTGGNQPGKPGGTNPPGHNPPNKPVNPPNKPAGGNPPGKPGNPPNKPTNPPNNPPGHPPVKPPTNPPSKPPVNPPSNPPKAPPSKPPTPPAKPPSNPPPKAPPTKPPTPPAKPPTPPSKPPTPPSKPPVPPSKPPTPPSKPPTPPSKPPAPPAKPPTPPTKPPTPPPSNPPTPPSKPPANPPGKPGNPPKDVPK